MKRVAFVSLTALGAACMVIGALVLILTLPAHDEGSLTTVSDLVEKRIP